MTYKITAKCKGRKVTEEVDSIRALNGWLGAYRKNGWKVTDVSRVRSVVR